MPSLVGMTPPEQLLELRVIQADLRAAVNDMLKNEVPQAYPPVSLPQHLPLQVELCKTLRYTLKPL